MCSIKGEENPFRNASIDLSSRFADYIADDINSDNQSDLAMYSASRDSHATVGSSSGAIPVSMNSNSVSSGTALVNANSKPLTDASSAPSLTRLTGNTLEESMQVLQEGLDSGESLSAFEQLYRRKPGMTMNVARQPENVVKNRYRDISPCKCSFVDETCDERFPLCLPASFDR